MNMFEYIAETWRIPMVIIDRWYQLIALVRIKFITKMVFVWWNNVIAFYRHLVMWWGWLVLAAFGLYYIYDVMAAYAGTGERGIMRYIVLLSDYLLPIEVARAVFIAIFFGLVILIIRPSKLPKRWEYYAKYLWFLFVCGISGFSWISFFHFSPRVPAYLELYLIFAGLFLLDAAAGFFEVLRSLTVLPLRFFVYNLPVFFVLYPLLWIAGWVPAFIYIVALLPGITIFCTMLYTISVNNGYVDYYGEM